MDADILVFLLVVGLRFIIPLFIIRYPLPAILAALVLDAADQTIFQQYTDLDLSGYQGYDKALDIYYLTIAYLSTLRNWPWPFAAKTATFLWYYRLIGVVLFELLHFRPLLLIFPNTFEYFFIAIEAIRTRYNPGKLTHKQIIKIAAFIWIFIKLPQEFWLHVLEFDFTDFMKVDVLGVAADDSWGDALSQNLWFVSLLVIAGVGVYFAIEHLKKIAPKTDWPATFNVNDHLRVKSLARPKKFAITNQLLEKVALMTMILTIFSRILPNSNPSALQLFGGVIVAVVANSLISEALARRGNSNSKIFGEFLVVLGANILAVATYDYLLTRFTDLKIDVQASLFYILLASVILTLYDRFSYQQANVEKFNLNNWNKSLNKLNKYITK